MLKLPFLGIFNKRSPLAGLLEHYEQIAKGMDLIGKSMECYIASGNGGVHSREFLPLMYELNAAEDKADKIKRNIRNHMPRGLFMPVDRVLFFTYTRQQDDILDAGQDSLWWLSMRQMYISEEFQAPLLKYLSEVTNTIKLLKPALEATISLITGEVLDREVVKENYRALRANHKIVSRDHNKLVSMVFNSNKDFKDIYQLTHFIKQLHAMSHSAEGCSDMLRAMIAR